MCLILPPSPCRQRPKYTHVDFEEAVHYITPVLSWAPRRIQNMCTGQFLRGRKTYCLIINCMEQSPYWEADNLAVGSDISSLLRNSMVHNRETLDSSQRPYVYSFNVHFNTILPSISTSSKLSDWILLFLPRVLMHTKSCIPTQWPLYLHF
jgi:hypothetical protein